MTTSGITAITPSVAQDLLRRHRLAPRKSDGQNFLVDPNTVRRIIEAADLHEDDHVLEVGPGLGSMTLILQDLVRKVTAVELDRGLAAVVGGLVADNVDVIEADVLDLDLTATFDAPVRLLSNLPYNAATPILLTLMDSGMVTDAYVMTQREVGDRWIAVPGDDAFGAVSVKVALLGDAAIDLMVPRAVFLPVPNVDSVMVRLKPHADPLPVMDRRRVGHVVDGCFVQRRKTMRNNVRRAWGDEAVAPAAEVVDLGRRAETLSSEEFIALTDAFVAAGLDLLDGPW